jgi:hypothetical protein
VVPALEGAAFICTECKAPIVEAAAGKPVQPGEEVPRGALEELLVQGLCAQIGGLQVGELGSGGVDGQAVPPPPPAAAAAPVMVTGDKFCETFHVSPADLRLALTRGKRGEALVFADVSSKGKGAKNIYQV